MKLIDLNIKIEYNPETDEIVGYTTSLNGVTEKTTTTRKALSKKRDDGSEAFLIREENKLILIILDQTLVITSRYVL